MASVTIGDNWREEVGARLVRRAFAHGLERVGWWMMDDGLSGRSQNKDGVRAEIGIRIVVCTLARVSSTCVDSPLPTRGGRGA